MFKPVYAFIDSQNLNLGIQDQGWKLDFTRFRVYLQDKFKVNKAFLFLGYIPSNYRLYESLRQAGYKLIFKPTVMDHAGKAKGNIDAELVLHTAKIEYDYYDKAVIVSGDGDFYCLIHYLVNNNKLEKLLVPNKKYSSLLRKFAPYIINIDLMKSKLKQ